LVKEDESRRGREDGPRCKRKGELRISDPELSVLEREESTTQSRFFEKSSKIKTAKSLFILTVGRKFLNFTVHGLFGG
jgi:hypothetical protein